MNNLEKEEKIKAGPALKRDICKVDLEKDHDTQSKNLFKYRAILAVVLRLCVSEFKDIPSSDVVGYIEKGTISVSTEVAEGETVRSENSESKPNDEKTLYFDVLFSVLSPKTDTEVSIGLKIDLEVQKYYKALKYPVENRGIYYLSRMISSQLNYIDDNTDYGKLQKVYSIWICTSDIRDVEKNTVVRYSIKGEKMYGQDFELPCADLMEMIVIKMGDVKSFESKDDNSSDDILEFLYGVFMYNTHSHFFEKYVDVEGSEDSEAIREELRTMSGTGDLLIQEARDETEQLVVKAGQLRDAGVTDIAEYLKEGISRTIAEVVLGVKPTTE